MLEAGHLWKCCCPISLCLSPLPCCGFAPKRSQGCSEEGEAGVTLKELQGGCRACLGVSRVSSALRCEPRCGPVGATELPLHHGCEALSLLCWVPGPSSVQPAVYLANGAGLHLSAWGGKSFSVLTAFAQLQTASLATVPPHPPPTPCLRSVKIPQRACRSLFFWLVAPPGSLFGSDLCGPHLFPRTLGITLCTSSWVPAWLGSTG